MGIELVVKKIFESEKVISVYFHQAINESTFILKTFKDSDVADDFGDFIEDETIIEFTDNLKVNFYNGKISLQLMANDSTDYTVIDNPVVQVEKVKGYIGSNFPKFNSLKYIPYWDDAILSKYTATQITTNIVELNKKETN